MKRFSLVSILVLFCLISVVVGMSRSAKSTSSSQAKNKSTAVKTASVKPFVIDNFESNSLKAPREWWTFDIRSAKTVANKGLTLGDKSVVKKIGKYSLIFKGPAKNWYAGGAGTYLAKENQDLSNYNAITFDIYGNGPGSGTLKVELLDDDNSNWQAEQDPAKNYSPVYDDKFVYDIRVDWKGWKQVTLYLDDFVDANPNVGDDVWNPDQKNDSGGLLQMQLICLGSKSNSMINFNLDNITLVEVD